ncbi:hypothetical protein [Tateyamaria sp.]|uniref:hypothetical protein n=1 Tax=Tateyamaria sp. TaxID=1929288 RepID=UPI00329DCD76
MSGKKRRLHTDEKGRQVDEKGRTFLERYVMKAKYQINPDTGLSDYAEAQKAQLWEDFGEGGGAEEAIRTRKSICKLNRRVISAELARIVDDWKPELTHAGMDVSIVKTIEDTFLQFYREIGSVPEDDLDLAIATLDDLDTGMKVAFEEIKATLLAYTGPSSDDGSDAAVTLWSMDLGRELIKELKGLDGNFDFLKIGPAPIEVTIPQSLYKAFEDRHDLMTPAQISHEATSIAQGVIARIKQLADGINTYNESLVQDVNTSREAGEVDFVDDEAAAQAMELMLGKYIDQIVAPQVAEMADEISRRVENLARVHADRAAALAEHLRHRKRRIARKFIAPVLGVAAGVFGVLLGTGLIALAPCTGGLSAVGGVGVVLASVAAIRGFASGVKVAYDETRDLAKATKSLEKTADALIKSYEKGSVPGKEIAAATLNSILVGTIIKSFPRLQEKFDLIERRMAVITNKQIEMSSDLDQLLIRTKEDEKEMLRVGIDEETTQIVVEALEETADKMINEIIDLGKAVEIGADGKSFNTIFATAKELLAQIESMIGSKTAKATAIIPVVTEFAFLIANAAVGCAGLFEAVNTLQVAVNGAVVISGEIGDGIGAVDAV